MTKREKKSYYQAVFNVKVRSIVNDTEKFDSDIVYEIAQLMNYCDSCCHCKANLDNAELSCCAGGSFNFNDLNCKRSERQVTNNYTF